MGDPDASSIINAEHALLLLVLHTACQYDSARFFEEFHHACQKTMNMSEMSRFWPLLLTNVVSVGCSLFLLTVLFTDQGLRKAMNNHLIMILLLVNLFSQCIDNGAYLNYLCMGTVWPATPVMCVLWILVAYQFYVTSTLLVALASIERHFLVFQNPGLWTGKRRLLMHYIPIAALLVYCLVYGLVLVTLIAKDGFPYGYSLRMCGSLATWIQNYPSLSLFDLIVNELLPTPIIGLFRIALLVRVLRQKQRIHRRIEWRKQRKMTIQLLSIAALFFVINFPPIVSYALIMLVGYEKSARYRQHSLLPRVSHLLSKCASAIRLPLVTVAKCEECH